jgi:hypothetical protein
MKIKIEGNDSEEKISYSMEDKSIDLTNKKNIVLNVQYW